MMIIVFDSVCNFCNGWVRFVLAHDRAGVFRFASAQSKFGRQVLAGIAEDPDNPSTLVLMDGEDRHLRSDAALRILAALGGAWKLLSMLQLLPKGLRDGAYDIFARHRYAWFGRSEYCAVPDARRRDRFMS